MTFVAEDETRETKPRRVYAQFDDVDDEKPTAYATRAPEPETTAAETVEEKTYPAEGDETDIKPESGTVLTEENYRTVLTNVIGGGALVHTNFRECFTDNYMAHLDEFNRSNPLYKHIDMNEWQEGEFMSGECVIRIVDVASYRYSYTIVDGKLDSITFVGEE